MKVHDIMVRDAKSCYTDTNLAAATAIMWNSGCGALPVLDGRERVVGLITDRDICVAAGTRNRLPSDIRVGDVVPERVFTCSGKDEIHSALKTMQTYQVRRLPVVGHDGKLEGILCLDDIALKASKSDALSYEDLATTFKAICEHRASREALAA